MLDEFQSLEVHLSIAEVGIARRKDTPARDWLSYMEAWPHEY